LIVRQDGVWKFPSIRVNDGELLNQVSEREKEEEKIYFILFFSNFKLIDNMNYRLPKKLFKNHLVDNFLMKK